jgi:hypothetical protein
MALADIVLEGLTLILVIALGAVLIGGLSYLTTTTASANNARLMTAGTYVYLAGPTYINSTLYIPMYNIGKYAVDVKYLFVKGVNGIQEYTTNIILKPGQYYVYELGIDYTPKAVTIVVSPINDPRLALEFSSNVTTPGPITPVGTSLSAQGCPVLASVSDSQNAGWEVTWTMAGGTYSVTKSTSYEWCILPLYYPITINFQSTIIQSPSGYQCRISPQTAQVNYEGKPETQSFTVTCQQQQQPPPPPPPPPPPGGGNEYAYVYTDISAPSSVSWTVYLYFDGQLDATYQGSGSQSYGPAVFSSSGTVNYEVSGIPNTCTASYSPSQSFSITPGNSYTETITITCQGQQPPPPPPTPECYFSYSASTNPSGLQMPSSFGLSGPPSLSPGSSGDFGGSAPLTAVDSQGDEYQFQYWSVTSNPSGYAWSGTTNQASFSAPLSCPSSLTSSVTVQVTGTAVYQFIGCESYSVGITLDTSGEATLSWSWCPLDPAVSWSAKASQGSSSNTIVATGYLTSKSGQTFGKSSQQVQVCGNNQQAVVTGVNPSGGSINPPQASNSVTFQVEFTCESKNIN